LPTVPSGSDAVVTCSGAALTVMLRGFDAVAFAESVTCAVKLVVPGEVGVPEIVLPLSDSPAGSAVTVQV